MEPARAGLTAAVNRHTLCAMPTLRRIPHLLFALVLLAVPARATWSIVIVDTATGEVAIGIATCLTGFDLRPETVVVVPGYGVAAAQSFVGPLSLRQLIRAELELGTPPATILNLLASADPGHQSRQYGIASVQGLASTFTGGNAGAFANGLTGQVGTLVYAIQGNVITGQPVLDQAEIALRTTPGSMADKLMASMEAARLMGGDGRCSCTTGGPASCGSPPANFTKSAHIGLMIVSRPGDFNPPCGGSLGGGCGNGTYYMDLNVARQQASALDPVLQLQALYNAWKAQQAGRPDHFRSSLTISGAQMRANGRDMLTGTVTLRDIAGNLPTTNPTVSVRAGSESSTNDVSFGPVTALGNGQYSFSVIAGRTPGEIVLDVVADDGIGNPIVVNPRPTITIGDAFGACGAGAIGDGQGGVIDALKIDGSAGVDRELNIGFAQPFVLTIDPPVGATGGQVGAFALWANLGLPNNGAIRLGNGGGQLCFTPFPLDPSAPSLLVADSLGLGAFLPATPAPWQVTVPGVNDLLSLTLQGVMVRNAQGELAATNAVLLTVDPLPQPTISMVSPLTATAGQTVTVTGTEFYPNLALALNGAPLGPTSVTPTSLTFAMPAGIGCDATVSVTNPGGAPVTASVNPTPTITNIPFAAGPAAGNALFLLAGNNLLGTTVTIGGAPLRVTNQSNVSILGSTPPGTPGTAAVVVQNALGCQDVGTYTYQ